VALSCPSAWCLFVCLQRTGFKDEDGAVVRQNLTRCCDTNLNKVRQRLG
jgi:hypothetical protein